MKPISRTCQECGERFATTHHATRFCTPAHKTAFHNRQMKRGQVLLPLLLTWRLDRGGSAEAKYAWREISALADQWNAEDRTAGRPTCKGIVTRKMNSFWHATDLLNT